jgi:hypothetical protein
LLVVVARIRLPRWCSAPLGTFVAAICQAPRLAASRAASRISMQPGAVAMMPSRGAAGFTVEGDNNPAPDPWQPRDGDVAGRLWVLVPGLGRFIVLAHEPAIAGALAVSLLVMTMVARQPRYRVRAGWIAFSAAGHPNPTA